MAAAANGGWAVVGSKKGKPQAGTGAAAKAPQSKAAKKKTAESMPKIIPILPMKESPTIYDAFIEEEEREEKRLELEKEGKGGSGGNKKQIGPGVKKLGGDRKREPPTLDNTVPELDEEELRKILDVTKRTFPTNPDIWLKDLASGLNLSLDKIPDIGPVYEGKPIDYPMCLLPSDVHDLLLQTISEAQKMSPSALELSLEYCVDSILNDLNKGVTSHGHRLFIQLLLFHRPETAIKSLEKYLAVLQKSQSRPLRSLSVMWIIGQAGHSSLANGLKVWLTLMLPVLSIRHLAAYAVDYLEELFGLHDNLEAGFGVVPKADFFRIFSEVYGDQSNLPTDLQKRLHLLYPKIRAVAWGDIISNLPNFFPAFLSRCTPDCNDSKRSELLDCLVTCLSRDAQAFSIWRQSYTKNMLQSSILLKYLAIHLDDLNINRKILRETVRAFHLTNEELASDQQMQRRPEYHSAVVNCKELLTKLNRIRFPWVSIFLLIVFMFIVAFFADVMTSKSLHDSRTVRFLEEAGILYFLQHAWNRICIYSSKIWLWLGDNVPDHVTKLWQIISPYCFLFWEKVVLVAVYLSEASKPYRQWLMDKLDAYYPVVLQFVGEHAHTALLWTFEMATRLWNIIVYCFVTITDWLLLNVFTGSLHPENIVAKISAVALSVKPYFDAVVEWIYSFFDRK